MAGACKGDFEIAWVICLVALALLLIGTFGLFGQEQDPTSGVFLVPLGLTWVLLLDGYTGKLRSCLAALALPFNLAILTFVCAASRGAHRRNTIKA